MLSIALAYAVTGSIDFEGVEASRYVPSSRLQWMIPSFRIGSSMTKAYENTNGLGEALELSVSAQNSRTLRAFEDISV